MRRRTGGGRGAKGRKRRRRRRRARPRGGYWSSVLHIGEIKWMKIGWRRPTGEEEREELREEGVDLDEGDEALAHLLLAQTILLELQTQLRDAVNVHGHLHGWREAQGNANEGQKIDLPS